MLEAQGEAKSNSAQLSPYVLFSVAAIAVVAAAVAAWFLVVNRRQKLKVSRICGL